MRLLADTQILIWYVLTPERLSPVAVAALDAETAGNVKIGVSAHTLVEIAYAAEKSKNSLTADDVDTIRTVLHDPASPFEVVSLDFAIGEHVGVVPRAANADPGDRIVVSTAEVLDLAIVSSDRKIPAMTSQRVIW